MRNLTLIISFYFLLVSGLPVFKGSLVTENTQQGVVCCENSCEDSNSSESSNQTPCNDSCNPLIFCHCCPGFVMGDYLSIYFLDFQNPILKFVYQNSSVSAGYFEIWLPPKIS